jgi:hypothetical protein
MTGAYRDAGVELSPTTNKDGNTTWGMGTIHLMPLANNETTTCQKRHTPIHGGPNSSERSAEERLDPKGRCSADLQPTFTQQDDLKPVPPAGPDLPY